MNAANIIVATGPDGKSTRLPTVPTRSNRELMITGSTSAATCPSQRRGDFAFTATRLDRRLPRVSTPLLESIGVMVRIPTLG